MREQRLLLVATGTGIAPFHSFVTSYPQLNYQLLHGVRTVEDCYDRTVYAADRYGACVTRGPGGYQGRVTGFLAQSPPPAESLVFLCGNSQMIFEAFDLLKAGGIPGDNLFAEVYF
jgi:ferredoxin--NADP+ reductase/benzoate/toluate 1,2-dioxygenase reductase subunit